MNRITKNLDKFNKLFDLAQFLIPLSPFLLLILLSVILIIVKIKFYNNLINKLS